MSSFFIADLEIGFRLSQYIYPEPTQNEIISDVVLVKKNDKKTELTYNIRVIIDSPPPGINAAANGSDYFSFLEDKVLFLPTHQNVTLPFILLPDDLLEGIEGFRITSAYNFPA